MKTLFLALAVFGLTFTCLAQKVRLGDVNMRDVVVVTNEQDAVALAAVDGKVSTSDAAYLAACTNSAYYAGLTTYVSNRVVYIGTNAFTGGGGTAQTNVAHNSLLGIGGAGTLHVSVAETNRIANALTNTPTLQAVVNASDGATTNLPPLDGGTWAIGNNGRMVMGTELSLANIAENAYGAQQSGNNDGTQTIGLYASGAQQSGWNDGTRTIGNAAHGAQQSGYNFGTQTIGLMAYGAQQRGLLATTTTATNNGVGAVQLLKLSADQNALTTAEGAASILLGAGVSSNKNAIVAGDGQVSHGDGSVTAGGGFWGQGSGLTDIPIAGVTGLQGALDGKLGTNATPAQIGAVSNSAAGISAAGGLTNGQSVADSALSNLFREVWSRQINPWIMPMNETPVAEITAKNGLTLSVTFPPSHLHLGGDSFYTIPAYTGTLTNTKGMVLNISNPNSATWTTVNLTDTKANTNRLPIAFNWYGRMWSPFGNVQSMFDDAETKLSNPTNITVGASGCMFTNITDAIASVVDTSPSSQYFILVKPGYYYEPGPFTNGLVLKDYVHIVGAGRDLVTIRGPEKAPGSEALASTINTPANCDISGMTIEAYKCKYAFHNDSTSGGDVLTRNTRTMTLADCNLRHWGGADGYTNAIGIGLYWNQTLNIVNCNIEGQGVFIHGASTLRIAGTKWALNIIGSRMRNLAIDDFMEYTKNDVTISGCEVEEIILDWKPQYYNSLPSNPLYNQGWWHRSVDVISDSSDIGAITYQTNSVTYEPAQRLVFAGFNMNVYSTNAVPTGVAVKLLPNPNADAYPSVKLNRNNVSRWDGGGMFVGVAESSIDAATNGVVQISGSPKVLADGTTPIVFGDELEINATGVFVKKATGALRGYAMEPLASGASLIRARIITVKQ